MNVFVLCTGRCGSTTFIRSCEHMTNYSTGHEGRARLIGEARFAYPPNHIEADNRLSWTLGALDEAYGDNAYYVHLHRDPEAVARSLNHRWNSPISIMAAYAHGIKKRSKADPLDICRDSVAMQTANIRHYLRDKSNVMDFPMEDAGTLFPEFWRWIGAEGDLDAALAEWRTKHNATDTPLQQA